MASIVFLYVTAPDVETARHIGSALVSEGIAACVNILSPMTSIYQWAGSVETASEVPFLVKTTSNRSGEASERILALHPYDCPCIAALPISADGSSSAFLEWLSQSVSTPES